MIKHSGLGYHSPHYVIMITGDNNEDQSALEKTETSEVVTSGNAGVAKEEKRSKDKDPKLKFITQTEALLSVESKADFQDVLKRLCLLKKIYFDIQKAFL